MRSLIVTRDILDRHVRVYAVLVEEVDRVDAQPLERCLGNFPDVLRTAVEAAAPHGGARVDVETKLGRNDDLRAEGRERFADQLLIRPRAVRFRGVEEGDAPVDGSVDEPD